MKRILCTYSENRVRPTARALDPCLLVAMGTKIDWERRCLGANSFPELRSPWPAVGKRELWKSSGSIHFRHALHRCRLRLHSEPDNQILVIQLTAQWQSASMAHALAHAWNGCSQSSHFPTADQGERSSGNEIALGATISGMRHRCRLRSETGWAEFGYFLCYFKHLNGCSQSSRFSTVGQGERRLWEQDYKGKDATIPCEPNTAYKESHTFCSICSCAIEIMYAGFEGFRTFLYVFMSVFEVSLH